MYQEVQEPLMNSVIGDAGAGSQYASNNTGQSGTQNGSQNGLGFLLIFLLCFNY